MGYENRQHRGFLLADSRCTHGMNTQVQVELACQGNHCGIDVVRRQIRQLPGLGLSMKRTT